MQNDILLIEKSHIQGLGLFAKYSISKNTIISRMISPIFISNISEIEQIGCPHDCAFHTPKGIIFDQYCKSGKMPDWYHMNHQRVGNILAQFSHDKTSIEFKTRRNILSGEELVYNYGRVPREWNM